MERKKAGIIFISIILLAVVYAAYPFLDSKLEGFLIQHETAHIDRIIDGDTVESNETSIRMLGINTPEKGEEYSQEAKEFLESLVLNKTVVLEFGADKTDLYGRTLAYLYYRGENINKKQIEQGFANYYFPTAKDRHYSDFKEAWEKCLEKNENLCEMSKDSCASCIGIKEFDYKNDKVVFENSCDFDCELTDWDIKDEGRKHFTFPEFTLKSNKDIEVIVGKGTNTDNTLYWERKDYVWTNTGDTLFLRDEKRRLILWEGY